MTTISGTRRQLFMSAEASLHYYQGWSGSAVSYYLFVYLATCPNSVILAGLRPLKSWHQADLIQNQGSGPRPHIRRPLEPRGWSSPESTEPHQVAPKRRRPAPRRTAFESEGSSQARSNHNQHMLIILLIQYHCPLPVRSPPHK